jgi:hypothetical protein
LFASTARTLSCAESIDRTSTARSCSAGEAFGPGGGDGEALPRTAAHRTLSEISASVAVS